MWGAWSGGVEHIVEKRQEKKGNRRKNLVGSQGHYIGRHRKLVGKQIGINSWKRGSTESDTGENSPQSF